MTVTSFRRALVLAFGIFLALALALASARPAAATLNQPSWSSGDFWTWTWTSGSTVTTRTWTVLEKTSLTLTTGTYAVWHVNETTSVTSGSTTITGWDELWIQDTNLGLAKSVAQEGGVGTRTVTYDPPRAGAVFPLNGNSWSLTTTITTVFLGTRTQTQTYSGLVLGEQDLTVPAGSFHVAPVRSPASGSSYQQNYYADSVGNWVRQDTYVLGSPASSFVLTSYRYQSASLTTLLWILGGLGIVAIVAVGMLYFLRHRRPRYPMHYPQTPPPSQPPQQPGNPPGPPSGM